MDSASIVILSGLVIGLVYGSVGLLSGFCLMSGMRGWLAEGDGRLIRCLCAGDRRGGRRDAIAGGGRPRRHRQVDLSAALVLGAGDVLRRAAVRLRHGAVERLRLTCAGVARARQSSLLRGRGGAGDIRADDAEGADRACAHCDGWSVADSNHGKFGAGVARGCGLERNGRAHAGSFDHCSGADHLRSCASGVPPFAGPGRRGPRGRPAGGGGLVRHRLSRRRRFQPGAGDLAHLHRADRGRAAICHAVDGIDAQFRHRHRVRRVRRQPRDRAPDRALPASKAINRRATCCARAEARR